MERSSQISFTSISNACIIRLNEIQAIVSRNSMTRLALVIGDETDPGE